MGEGEGTEGEPPSEIEWQIAALAQVVDELLDALREDTDVDLEGAREKMGLFADHLHPEFKQRLFSGWISPYGWVDSEGRSVDIDGNPLGPGESPD